VESVENVVTMKEVDPQSMEQLLEFVYTGCIEIREDNVQSLLPCASLLQLEEVCEASCDYLQNQLHPSNCLGIRHFADIHSCQNLQVSANVYAQRHFSSVRKTEEFLSLSFDHVMDLVSSDELGVDKEEDVFESIVAWVKHNTKDRIEHLPALLEKVRLLLVPKDYLVKCVLPETLLADCLPVKDFIIEALSYHLMCSQDKVSYVSPRSVPRKRTGPPFILVVGGQAPKAVSQVEIYNAKEKLSYYAPELLSRRCRCGVAMIDRDVYCVGGFDGSARVRTVERLDLDRGVWTPTTCLLCRRSTLGVAVLDRKLYAVGGFDGSNGLETMERFDPDTQAWSPVASMSTRRSSVGVAVLGGFLYAVGGYDGVTRSCLNTVECYNPQTDKWTSVEPMNQRRSGAAVAVLDDCIYAIGGHDGPDIRKSVERYDPKSQKWVRIPDMFTCRRNASAVVIQGLLFVLGGDDGMANLSTIETYDAYTNTWEFALGNLLLGRSYAGVVATGVLPESLMSSPVPESVSHQRQLPLP
jgi:kelch-like protein 2/3